MHTAESASEGGCARSTICLTVTAVSSAVRRYQTFAQRGASDDVAPLGTAGNPLYDSASPSGASPRAPPRLAALQAAAHRHSDAQPAADGSSARADVSRTLPQIGAPTDRAQPMSWASMSHSQLVEHCLSSARADVSRAADTAFVSAPSPPQSKPAAQENITQQVGQRRELQFVAEAHVRPAAGRPAQQLTSPDTPGVSAAGGTGMNTAASNSGGDPATPVAGPPSPVGPLPAPGVPGAGCLRTSPGGLSDSVCSSRHGPAAHRGCSLACRSTTGTAPVLMQRSDRQQAWSHPRGPCQAVCTQHTCRSGATSTMQTVSLTVELLSCIDVSPSEFLCRT